MSNTLAFRASGDRIYAVLPREVPGGLGAVVEAVRQNLPGVTVDWVAVRETYRYGRERPFPVASRDPESRLDEKAKVRFAPDGLAAYLLLYPPKARGERLTEAELGQLLQAYGIPRDLVDVQALRMAHARRNYLEPERVAVGHPPTDGRPSWVAWTKGLPSDPEGFLDALDREDDYPDEILALVHEGEEIGTHHPPGGGSAGISVRGEPIPARPGADQVALGDGVGLAPGGRTVVAQRSGHLRLSRPGGTSAEVLPALHVDDPQELKEWAGKVFPGSLIVEGDLEILFPLRVLGDLEVRGGIIRSAVEVLGSLFVRGGVIQYRETPLRVGGIVSAAFLERSWVMARTVHVRGHSLKSRLHALDAFVTPPSASVQGGRVATRSSLRAGTLGSRNGMPTELVVGDPSMVSQFQDLFQRWAAWFSAPGEDGSPPPEDLLRVAGVWEEKAAEIGTPDPLRVSVEVGSLNPGVTVRIGTALRRIENPVGPVGLSYERIGPRGRVAMTRREP